jgi:quinol monooxygenase YgiN
MHAQVVQGGTTPEKRDEMNRIVHEMLVPALQAEKGFVGALNLEDRESGHGLMIQVWETEEQAAQMPDSDAFRKALGAIMAVSTGERAPIKVWRVNAFVGTTKP